MATEMLPRTAVESPAGRSFATQTVVLLLLIVLAGAVLRTATLRHEALDCDEIYSRRTSLLPIAGMINESRSDVHPPFYLALLKSGITMWGASPLGLRLLSLVLGLATIVLTVKVAKTLPEAQYCGILAAAILALNETHIFFSQEARSYALYAFLMMLLVLWVAALEVEKHPTWVWPVGWVLMVLLVYTHYIATIYVLFVVVGIFISGLPFKTKIYSLITSVLAAMAFVPWLFYLVAFRHSRAPVTKNLQGLASDALNVGKLNPLFAHQGLYGLKSVWASSIGILQMKGATTISLCLVLALAAVAVLPFSRQQKFPRQPVLIVLALLTFLPPVVVFVLSERPFNLPIFGLRHFLPSLVALIVLSSYGLEKLSWHFNHHQKVFVSGSAILLVIAAGATADRIYHSPTRYPYNLVAKQVMEEQGMNRPVYTTWFYGIGETVNFYCGNICAQPLAHAQSELPNKIILLYRPAAPWELKKYRDLVAHGYTPTSARHYTNGKNEPYGVELVHMEKAGD